MATYTVREGESITDCTLNSLGDISAWEAYLTANFFDSWTPNLFSGQVLSIPDNAPNNQGNIKDLAAYPANNFSVPDIQGQINEIFNLMVGLTPIPSDGVLPEIDTGVFYSVRPLETVGDYILNSTGDIENWDLLTQNAFFDTWTPLLYAGQRIPVASTANQSLNNFRSLNQYPANNFSVPDIYEQINAIFDTLNPTQDLWILRFGYWLDTPSRWEDDKFWIDNL